MTNKFQKDLDDIRDEVGIPLRSVRRQFDNLRRVFDFYDDVGDNVVMTTQTLLEIEYFLPDHLSRAYSCALFLLVHRFQLQISKKKYRYSLHSRIFRFSKREYVGNYTKRAKKGSRIWTRRLPRDR